MEELEGICGRSDNKSEQKPFKLSLTQPLSIRFMIFCHRICASSQLRLFSSVSIFFLSFAPSGFAKRLRHGNIIYKHTLVEISGDE
jgi:hypothetical protein